MAFCRTSFISALQVNALCYQGAEVNLGIECDQSSPITEAVFLILNAPPFFNKQRIFAFCESLSFSTHGKCNSCVPCLPFSFL